MWYQEVGSKTSVSETETLDTAFIPTGYLSWLKLPKGIGQPLQGTMPSSSLLTKLSTSLKFLSGAPIRGLPTECFSWPALGLYDMLEFYLWLNV